MPNFLPSHYAEFQAPVSTGGVFYAAWPRNASSRDLRAISGMLSQTLEWWADKLSAIERGNAEYDSWIVSFLSGAPAGAPSEQKEGSVHQAAPQTSTPSAVHSGEAPASAPLAGGSAQ